MAGKIIVSTLQSDTDNSISFVANTGATIFSANLSHGIAGSFIANGSITGDKIASVANTQITGNITSSQITSVANTQITGNITSSQITSVANTQITGILAAANGGTGNDGGAWTSYTPTITASSGTFGSTSTTAYYRTIGKTCFVSLSISITSVGSASGTVYATLPVTTASRVQIGGYGMEVVNVGSMLKGYCVSSGTQLQITYYNNTSPISLNNQLVMTVVYETA